MRLPGRRDRGDGAAAPPPTPAADTRRPGRPPRPGRDVAGRMTVAGLLVALCTGATAFTVAREEAGIAQDILLDGGAVDADARRALDAPLPGGPRTVLLIGDDRRFGDEGGTRSDTMILVRFDPDAAAITTMALPRDLRVDIPGVGRERLNAAFAEGGSRKAIATIKGLLELRINHYASVRFGAFARAVNRLGCFYVDVDRTYFNDNAPPVGGGERYAAIDLGAGYQRLCGQDALSFVRFRHLDNDLVRADRQQQFLAEARSQVGAREILGDRRGLLEAVATYLRTDLGDDEDEVLGVLRLAVETLGKPLVEVPFPGKSSGDFVTVDEDDLDDAREEFLRPRTGGAASESGASGSAPVPGGDGADGDGGSAGNGGSSGGESGAGGSAGRSSTPAMLTRVRSAPLSTAAELQRRTDGLPVYVPDLQFRYGGLPAGMSRPYRIAPPDGRGAGYRAYRYVVWTGIPGQYYGVQGTEWRNVPMLRSGGDPERLGGRDVRVQYAGRRIRRIVVPTDDGIHWVANTVSLTLTNAEMRALARTLRRAPASPPGEGAPLALGDPRRTGVLPSVGADRVIPAPGGLLAERLRSRPGVLREGAAVADGGGSPDADAGGGVQPTNPGPAQVPAAPAPVAPAPVAPAPVAPAPVAPVAPGAGAPGATGAP